MDQWVPPGNWKRLPDSFHESISDLETSYRPASEAFYSADSVVLDRETDKQARMKWIEIKWISEDEANVKQGTWSCPLGGSGWSGTYKRINGNWKRTKAGTVWVS